MTFHLSGYYPTWWKGIRFNHPIQAWAASDTSESTRDILQKTYLGDRHSLEGGLIHKSVIQRVTSRSGVADAVDTAFVFHKSGGLSELGLKSYDQGRKKFQGTHKHVVHLDEEPPLDVYSECMLRTTAVGEKAPGHVILTMTPLSGVTQVVQLYINEGAKPASSDLMAGSSPV